MHLATRFVAKGLAAQFPDYLEGAAVLRKSYVAWMPELAALDADAIPETEPDHDDDDVYHDGEDAVAGPREVTAALEASIAAAKDLHATEEDVIPSVQCPTIDLAHSATKTSLPTCLDDKRHTSCMHS